MKTVQEFVHTNKYGAGNDPERCEFSVRGEGRWPDYHQCQRKAQLEVDGIGFCFQHAKEVKRGLGLAEAKKVRYAASFEYGIPKLSECQVAHETSKTIEIIGHKNILGSYLLVDGQQNKDSQYLKPVKFFDTEQEAMEWLLEMATDYVGKLIQKTEQAEEIRKELLSRWGDFLPSAKMEE